MKVESKGDGDKACGWLDLEFDQSIALCREMEPKFVRNSKEKSIF